MSRDEESAHSFTATKKKHRWFIESVTKKYHDSGMLRRQKRRYLIAILSEWRFVRLPTCASRLSWVWGKGGERGLGEGRKACHNPIECSHDFGREINQSEHRRKLKFWILNGILNVLCLCKQTFRCILAHLSSEIFFTDREQAVTPMLWASSTWSWMILSRGHI